MSALTIAGSAVLAATVTMPRVGVWWAEVEVSTETALTGVVEIVPETGATWHGTVIAGGVHAGTWRGRIVGGAGGLRRTLPATSYRDATLHDVVADATRESGETLDAGTDLRSWAVSRFVRVERPASRAVADVACAASLPWRVTRAGTLLVAAESWAGVSLPDVTVASEGVHVQRYELAGGVLGIDPGTSITLPLEAGATIVRVSDVMHRIEGDEVTAVVWGVDG